MRENELGTQLSEHLVQKSRELPEKPSPVTLTGQFVRLEPLSLERDLDQLYKFSNGEPIQLNDRMIEAYDSAVMIWNYMSAGPFETKIALAAFLQRQIDASNTLCFCVYDLQSGSPIGVCNYLNNFPAHLKIELGNIWYSPIAQRTKANLETTYLLLEHAFSLGYRRVEWKCDSLNERSHKSALRMGFQFEGKQEQHFIIKGRNRDTDWFRILDCEWPQIRQSLEAKLKA
ncbi:MAG: GNAT family N-acetyltransferase [Leptolyngbya sp.]|nr:GNAT family N-acetyltransferase [Candidatus Melainabacteria bacterium]